MTSDNEAGWPARIWAAVGGVLVTLVGVAILGGGGWLIWLGGSPYYLFAGAAIVGSGVMLVRRHPAAGLVYAATLVVTLIWGLWEGGFHFWPLLPRLFAPAVLGLFILLVVPTAPKGLLRTQSALAVAALAVVMIATLGAAVPSTYTWGQAAVPAQVHPSAPAAEPAADWRSYGRDPGGSRYSPVDQINRENVEKLEVAWTFRTGEKVHRGNQDQNTPQMVGDTVYVCTPTNVVIAVDADTGKEKWRHDPKVKPFFWNRCRGVGYWDGTQPKVAVSGPSASKAAQPPARATPAAKAGVAAKAPAPKAAPPAPAMQTAAAPAPAGPLCRKRILSSTINAQLIALDADTGKRCPGFGKDGVVDLTVGIGAIKRGFYFQTSMPMVAGNVVLIGGWVMDNQELQEPSGVVRAFDVRTGELAWAWDAGNPEITRLPPEGQTYTRGTPNMWSTPAYDPDLNLVYLPIGNATPDYWGSHRSKAAEKYASSIVALDATTGRERWHFQTVHHDVWDYDVPSQPMLIDFPVKGGSAPALVQLTKRGQIFVLDRRTGQPLTRVVEVRVPQGPQPGEWLAPTQPYSVEMPAIGVERLTEKMMWGATPLDQLFCRIRFQSVRYDGDFTPPGSAAKPALQFPGNAGGMNWGSGAYDPRRGLLIVSDVRMPQTVALVPPRPQKRKALAVALMKDRPPESMKAVPYEADNNWFLSPLFAPCVQPPHGMLTAIDVRTRQIVWQVPAGTAEAQAPLGLKSNLPIPIGTLAVGGPITTAGGVTFRAATTDPYLRAYDNATGALIWQARLPVAAAGTPMTYVSPRTGKQYVVVVAGGDRVRGDAAAKAPKADYVIAYALK